MQIRSSKLMQSTQTAKPKQAAADKEAAPKQSFSTFLADKFESNSDQEPSDPSKKLIPAFLAVGGAAAGLIGGFADGIAGGIGGAVSLGAAGAAGATVMGAFEEFGGESPDYAKRATVGGAVGLGFGALIGSLSQSGAAAVGLAVAGTIGATLGYAFLKD